MKQKSSGWNIQDALRALKGQMDPYIWEQGQELFRRGAAEDFQMTAEGTIQVSVLDPRDARKFFVTVEKDRGGTVVARCKCPYRLGGFCRHQVVGLEYLKSIAEGPSAEAPAPSSKLAVEVLRPARAGDAVEPGATKAGGRATEEGPILYRLFGAGAGVATRPDGSLLRVVLHSLGSSKTRHRLGLQVFTGTGWTELRTADVSRWIGRGALAPHPRDELITAYLSAEGSLRLEVDSELLATLLTVLSGSDQLVDRGGRSLAVSPWPWRLAARLVRSTEGSLTVELACRSPEGEARPFDEVSLVPSVAPWIQLDDGTFHPLVAGAPGPLLLELQETDFSGLVAEGLDRFLSEGVLQLERLCPGAVETEPGLIEEVEGVVAARLRLEGAPQRLKGKLELSYGGEWVMAPETPEPWTVNRGATIHRYPPAGQSLARAERELQALGFRRLENAWALEGPRALLAVLAPRPRAFVQLLLPRELEALNLVDRAPTLRVEVGETGTLREGGGMREETLVDFQAAAASGGAGRGGEASGGQGEGASRWRRSGVSWLEATCSLTDGEKELSFDLPSLRKAFQGDPQGLLQLSDGTVLSLKHPSVRSLLELSSEGQVEHAAAGKHRLRLRLPRIGELMEEEPQREVKFGPQARALVEGLRTDLPVEPRALIPRIDEILRPYQKEAVRWLGHLASWGLSGLLADEMGLGKTVMALAHFFGRVDDADPGAGAPRAKRASGPVLVVCPSSLIFNWVGECRRFFPDVEVTGLYGVAPQAREELIKKGPALLVTSYALLRRDREALESREFRAVILDEAQHVKNAESQTAQAAFALRSDERWVLTGTPIENHLGELWSLFNFLLPGFLGTSAEFREKFADPISRGEDDVLSRLRVRVKPFLLRRTKAQVLSELPPRIEQVERVPMTDGQRRIYEACLLQARSQLEGADPGKSRFQLLAALTRLRQVCCHPRLVLGDEPPGGPGGEAPDLTCGKFELLRELLEECLEEGHRVLLFSQFTSMLDLIEDLLKELQAPRCRLDGSTRNREEEVRRFTRDASVPIFLISLKAGGFGLNLTQADTVILYDPWWNPAAEEQAAARAHRMGQTVPVHIHKLITASTVEEKILDLQASKRDLAEKVMRSEEEALEALTGDDLRELLFRD